MLHIVFWYWKELLLLCFLPSDDTRDSYAKSLNIGQYFTYDLYRWAVSCAMTRQNILPDYDGKQQVTTLVPLFDMCNHSNGRIVNH
ncbi:Actin-histidine N-methyltransferase like protein [Argiope bruennichi]|uniref:Actin-histidine N-methyltransferase like protein n=1 Tax=Argiope bruennichi TaxID=94029 RepID=A0A8T0EV43_ARGBR|nr:Actin-histidine N-methyltransferase like protein [Argiope bruennichi]